MLLEFIILLIIMIGGFAVLFWRLLKSKTDSSQDQGLIMLQNQINEISRTLDTKLGDSTKAMQSQFGATTKIVQDVTERLTKLDETNRQVMNFTDQLQQLQDILKNPKQRGILGEYYLEQVLKNVMPPGSYELQYKLGKDDNGNELIPDAAIFIKDKIVAIDSKFSLDNYNKIAVERDEVVRAQLEKMFKNDLKDRIDETSKYIRPEYNTLDFAFMFIPAEAIYYDLLVNKIGVVKVNTRDLIEYAFKEKHVIIVSPTSFHAYLQTVLQGLRALQIEESAKEIRKGVEKLQKHLSSYAVYLGKLGNNLGTTVNAYNTVSKEFGKIDKDVVKLTGRDSELEVQQLERPAID
ncbi:MAG: DNA recombination protein RmuC [Candidatus Komeilibacteria bacterium]|nr:DNA recombination protein RmuC [Candidatus Komeilibacteria bacterium]